MDDVNHLEPLKHALTYLVVLMANSCTVPAEHKDFGLLGGKACP